MFFFEPTCSVISGEKSKFVRAKGASGAPCPSPSLQGPSENKPRLQPI